MNRSSAWPLWCWNRDGKSGERMKVVTAEEMRRIDTRTIKDYGIPGTVLMERAGGAVAAKFIELFGAKKALVLAGSGNNGGDGLVAARELFNKGRNVKVLLTGKEGALSADCLVQYRAAKKAGVPMEFRTTITSADCHGAVVIDALFGTGLNKPVRTPYSDLIRSLNASGATVISVDVPSGISSDDGCVMGEAVRADYTVTFGLPKIGHLIHPGAEYTGKLFVEDIGFPEDLLRSARLNVETIDAAYAASLIPERPANSYKGDYGHVLVVAGSRGKTGAACLTAAACLRSGAGLVTIGVPESLTDVFQSRVVEEMILPLPDAGNGMLAASALDEILYFIAERADVLAMGPGVGVSDDMKKIMDGLVRMSAAPMVLDADAINSLAGRSDLFKKAKSPVVLTPHVGEMSRLVARQLVAEGKIEDARSFAKDTGTNLILKGAPSIVACADGRLSINTTGNPGMATAGSGDVLTGMVAAFIGQGLDPAAASVLAVYLHGLAGDIAASDKGMHSLIASDIIAAVPSAFLTLRKS